MIHVQDIAVPVEPQPVERFNRWLGRNEQTFPRSLEQRNFIGVDTHPDCLNFD